MVVSSVYWLGWCDQYAAKVGGQRFTLHYDQSWSKEDQSHRWHWTRTGAGNSKRNYQIQLSKDCWRWWLSQRTDTSRLERGIVFWSSGRWLSWLSFRRARYLCEGFCSSCLSCKGRICQACLWWNISSCYGMAERKIVGTPHVWIYWFLFWHYAIYNKRCPQSSCSTCQSGGAIALVHRLWHLSPCLVRLVRRCACQA